MTTNSPLLNEMRFAVLISLFVALGGEASSLLVPNGISYSYGEFVLTREVEASGSHQSEHRRRESSSVRVGEDQRTSSQNRMVDSDRETVATAPDGESGSALGSAIGGTIGAGFGGGLGKVIGSVIGGGLGNALFSNCDLLKKTEKSHVRTSSRQSLRTLELSQFSSVQRELSRVDQTVAMEGEQYGNWHLRFQVELASDSFEERYRLDLPARVWVRGLSQPLSAPVALSKSVEFGVDGVILAFDCPVRDVALLRELQNVYDWRQLRIDVRSAEFPLVSVRTGENVLAKMAEVQASTPTTEIALEFGDAAMRSPWCVKQRRVALFGRRPFVTLREALEAINADVARNPAMPPRTFDFSKDGVWTAISDVPFAEAVQPDDWRILAVRLQRADGTERVLPLEPSLLDANVRDYVRIVFGAFSLSHALRLSYRFPEHCAELEAAVLRVLASGRVPNGMKFWENGRRRLDDARKAELERTRRPEVPVGTIRSIKLPETLETMDFVWCQGHLRKDGFWIGRTEVTQRQWKSVMARNPSHFGTDAADHPVERVSWTDCQEFIRKLADRGLQLRLPTEKEWELACRAGREAEAFTYEALQEEAWFLDNADKKTHAVALKKANPWNICDMQGNVLEWCANSFGDTKNDSCRVVRGGFFGSEMKSCAPSFRDFCREGECYEALGFRLVWVSGEE